MDLSLPTATPLYSGAAVGPSPEIRGLTADSREVRPGFLFAALPGAKLDGRRFIADAIARGAVAILTDDPAGAGAVAGDRKIVVVGDGNPRRRLALMSARFHAPQPKTLAAITGTNGKTSVASFARQLWQAQGAPAASLGTLGIIGPDFTVPGAMTTPDPVGLHRELAALARRGIEHVALEASSHGLDQFRLDGLQIGLAAFTNLTHDHLDYHGTMDAYRAAKSRLFGEVMASGGTAVLNADSPEFAGLEALCARRGHRIIGYGRAEGAALRIVESRLDNGRLAVRLRILGQEAEIVFAQLAGDFQAMNALAALGLALGSGIPADDLLAPLAGLQSVPGRLQRVAGLPTGAAIYVDYAHTPDALETILTALRPHAARRLVVVFGCGGDRDALKRPVMGAIAARLADVAIVTDDNPRTEDAAKIRAAILVACPGAQEVGDREAAIRTAITGLDRGDLLIIAGKGHESGQIVGTTTHPFDDAEVARRIAAELAP